MKIWIIFQEARLFNVILTGAERKWPLVPTASLFADSSLATTQKKPQLTVLEMGSEEADHLALSSPLPHYWFPFLPPALDTILITFKLVFGKKSLR